MRARQVNGGCFFSGLLSGLVPLVANKQALGGSHANTLLQAYRDHIQNDRLQNLVEILVARKCRTAGKSSDSTAQDDLPKCLNARRECGMYVLRQIRW